MSVFHDKQLYGMTLLDITTKTMYRISEDDLYDTSLLEDLTAMGEYEVYLALQWFYDMKLIDFGTTRVM